VQFGLGAVSELAQNGIAQMKSACTPLRFRTVPVVTKNQSGSGGPMYPSLS
jgi:hypothetical protein